MEDSKGKFVTQEETGEPAAYRVDLPGGRLDITWRPDGRVLMTGPAVIVADGDLYWHDAA